MPNRRGDEYGEILDILARETRFLKTYTGKVLSVDDELARGRVKLSIPELGWLTEDQSPWTEPEYPLRGCIVPDVGDWVTVFFLAGNPARPVYRSRTGEIKDSWPASYTGPEMRILYDDGTTVIMYNTKEKKLSITGPETISIDGNATTLSGKTLTIDESDKITVDGSAIELNGNSKLFVTHAELNTALQLFITALNLHTHTSAASGSPTSPPVAPMTLDITNAKTTTIKTGG